MGRRSLAIVIGLASAAAVALLVQRTGTRVISAAATPDWHFLLAGLAISLLRAPLASTHGYAAMWLVCSAAILASIPFMRPLREKEERNRRERARRDSKERTRAPEPVSA